jgi:hypothetical protein
MQCRSYSALTIHGSYSAVFNIKLFCASVVIVVVVVVICGLVFSFIGVFHFSSVEGSVEKLYWEML